MKYDHYNIDLKENAKQLRTASISKAEKCLWKIVLSRKRMGIGFKRQRPIDRFIVDFFSQDINLIIEIDGSSHLNQSEYDQYRQERLEQLGYHFLRFNEGDVLNNLEKVFDEIEHAVHVLKDNLPLNPPPKGEVKEPPPKESNNVDESSPCEAMLCFPLQRGNIKEPSPTYKRGLGLLAK